MSPDFSQRYDCSMSISFSSKLRGNCPCILFPCHFSFVFYAVLSIFFLSFCTSVFRHLVVCNTDESVLCWCVLTTCISGSSFLSTYSTNFVVSTIWAASNCIKPLPPCFLGTYKRSTSALGDAVHEWLEVFLFYGLGFTHSSWCQLIIPKLYLSTGTVNTRKVLRPATSTQVFLGFPVSISKCWDGSPRFQVATTCFLCSSSDLNLLVTNFIFRIHVK